MCNCLNVNQSWALQAVPAHGNLDFMQVKATLGIRGRACEHTLLSALGEPLSPPQRSPHFLLSPAVSYLA